MGGNKLTNLANGSNPQDAVTVLQIFTDPTFTGTTVDGVKVTGTALTVTTTTVTLPAGTSIGNVSATELATLDGITSNVQTQLNAKSNLAGGNTFTGTQVMTAQLASASVGVTQAIGEASTKLATTQFVADTAMSAALPAQTGNAGKVPITDGTSTRWRPLAQRLYFFGQLG